MFKTLKAPLLALSVSLAWAGDGVYFVNNSDHPCTLAFKNAKVPLEAGVLGPDEADQCFRFRGSGRMTVPGKGGLAYISVPKSRAKTFAAVTFEVVDAMGEAQKRRITYYFVPASRAAAGEQLTGGAWGASDPPYHARAHNQLVHAKHDLFELRENELELPKTICH